MFTPGEEKREMDKGQQVNIFSLHIFMLFEIFNKTRSRSREGVPLVCPLKSGPLLLLSLSSLESTSLLSEPGAASHACRTLNYHFTTCHCKPSGLYLAQDVSQLINKQIHSEVSEGGDWRAKVSGFLGERKKCP